MICPECGARNKPGDRFCEQCGTPLAVPLPSASEHTDIESASTLMAPSGLGSAILTRVDSAGSEIHNIEARAVVGRLATCDIPVDDKSVSREHARFSQLRDGFVLEDLGSTNGTMVNGRRISETVLLQSGDTVTFGSIEFRYEVQDETVPTKDASAAETLTGFAALPSHSSEDVFSARGGPQFSAADPDPHRFPDNSSALESESPPVSFPPLEPFSPAARVTDPQPSPFVEDVEPTNMEAASPALSSGAFSIEHDVDGSLPADPGVASQFSSLSQPEDHAWNSGTSPDADSNENPSSRAREALLGMQHMIATISEYVDQQHHTERMLEQRKQELERAQRQLREASERLEQADRARKDLMSAFRDVPEPAMTRKQLVDLQDMLDTLIQNPRDVEILMKMGREAPSIAAVVNEYTQIRRIVERAEGNI